MTDHTVIPEPKLVTPESFLERALQSEKGVRVVFTTPTEAASFRLQCYILIRNERKRNQRELGEAVTEFDKLILSLTDATLTATFRAAELVVEDL